MIITSGQGITPKQLEENSVIRRAESHKINSTFKVPTFFQNASGGAYIAVSYGDYHYENVYIDGKNVYSVNSISNSGDLRKEAISKVPQVIKTKKIKLVSTEIEDVEKLIIKSFSFTSTSPLTYYYFDTDRGDWYSINLCTPENANAFRYSGKFDDIHNCTLIGNLTIEKDGIYLTEHYVCIRQYIGSSVPSVGSTSKVSTSDEATAIKNGTFEMSFACNFGISFIEFK